MRRRRRVVAVRRHRTRADRRLDHVERRGTTLRAIPGDRLRCDQRHARNGRGTPRPARVADPASGCCAGSGTRRRDLRVAANTEADLHRMESKIDALLGGPSAAEGAGVTDSDTFEHDGATQRWIARPRTTRSTMVESSPCTSGTSHSRSHERRSLRRAPQQVSAPGRASRRGLDREGAAALPVARLRLRPTHRVSTFRIHRQARVVSR